MTGAGGKRPGGRIDRRRLITVVGVAGGAAVASGAALLGGRRLEPVEWTGAALGAPARILLFHEDPARAEALLAATAAEVRRLEGVFSLFRGDSDLSRLNRDGRLEGPDPDLVALLRQSALFSEATGGAFDPTVQPLWEACVEGFAAGGPPAPAAIERAARLVGWRDVAVADGAVSFRRPGMALTLNGIAQGWITDRVADLLRAGGLRHVLVELGETRGIGRHPEGRAWRIGVPDPDGRGLAGEIDLGDEAVATSGGYGTPFDEEGRWHHIFDPATGMPAHRHRSVTVAAPTATEADALATAFAVMPEGRAAAAAAARGARALVVDAGGALRPLGA